MGFWFLRSNVFFSLSIFWSRSNMLCVIYCTQLCSKKKKRKRKRKTSFFSSSIFRFMKLSGTDTDSDRFSSVGFFLPNFRRVHRVSSDSVPANYFDFSLNCVEFKCDPRSFLPFCGVFLFAGVTLSISQWID